jgi:NAD(P)-dependent dehydrogenase (short-subunit alcohol dehydrogenase family)
MAGQFVGKVALVTGGAAGIGRASAQAFARVGAKVVLADVDSGGGEATRRLIEESCGQAVFVSADVAKATDVEAMIDAAVKRWGRLDYAHNNAGVGESRVAFADMTEEIWDRTMSVNLRGVWLCMKYEIRRMLEQGGGAIVNTSSAVGLVGARQQCAYVASKHGVIGLTKAAALEYAKAGIRVNAVCPGAIRTPALDSFFSSSPQIQARVIAQHPVGRVGTSEEVAEAVLWLCSDAASFITGHALAVDGGATAQ